MSQVLSGLILTQLQASNPNPFFAVQQKQLADAIATAVQAYIQTSVTVTPGQVVATAGTAVAQSGTTTTPGTLIAL